MNRESLPPEIVPFAPALYLAWADGLLTREEIDAVRARAERAEGLDPETRSLLGRWLDPERPPSSEGLSSLLDLIHEAAPRLRESARFSVADLGQELARLQSSETANRQAVLRRALEDIEAALGVVGAEAARSLITEPPRRAAEPDRRETAFDPAALHALIDRDHAPLRREVMELISTPELRPRPEHDSDPDGYRAATLERCRILAARGLGALGLPSEFGGRDDIGAAIATFETLAYGDLSLLVKFGVQFGLFAGSILQLGTRRHHVEWLRAAASLELPGCYAMTETGHGSNVRDIRTTATYDHATSALIVHTPDRQAWKDYIGNAALHGRAAVVFAQLEVAGARQGVHALLVPIRDQNGIPAPGVTIEDCGRKHGLNGVDNGRIAFDHVRVPRENLLDRFGGIAPDGTYRSSIASPTRRFFRMLGTLVAGRVSIAAASLSAAKTGLVVAVRYTDGRRQFGPEGGVEMPVLDYLTMQRRLLPRITKAIALDFAMSDLTRRYAASPGQPDERIETLAAAFKVHASDFAVETLRHCREACGGQGYMASNRLPALMADAEIFTTFEGANTVLQQLVIKGLLSDYREEFGELSLWGIARYMGGRAATTLSELNPVVTRRTDEEHIEDPAFHSAALRWREERLLATLARRLKRRIDAGEDSFSALNACQDHAVLLATAHVERHVLEQLHVGIAECSDERLGPVLRSAAVLHGLATIEGSVGWFLEKGYLEPNKARAVRDRLNALCHRVRPHAVALVDGFGVPDVLIPDIARR